MLHGKKVTLRSIRREDLQRQSEFNNDVECELLRGGEYLQGLLREEWEPTRLT